MTLQFGTSGLRGPMQDGPDGINEDTLSRATAGLMQYLFEENVPGPVVVGFDARRGSRRFAQLTAELAAGAGYDVLLLPEALPTPVLVYAARIHEAAAGVMVTASHNPAGDNGCKIYVKHPVYGVSPLTTEQAPRVEAAMKAAVLPPRGSYTQLNVDLVDAYQRDILEMLPKQAAGAREDLVIAYTPLHGVGGGVSLRASELAGFTQVHTVASQQEPDGDFPTVEYPNPENAGAMERVLATAHEVQADLVLAHDPDADRLAVAVRENSGYRTLSGDQIGALLGEFLAKRGVRGSFATTRVSSPLLHKIAAEHGVACVETQTGFKHLINARDDLAYAYEESIGFAVAPHLVPDKDGISAGLLVAALASELKREGCTLWDAYTLLWEAHGVHMGTQHVQRFASLEQRDAAFAALPESQRELITDDLRIITRASGTEPLMKTYVHIWNSPRTR